MENENIDRYEEMVREFKAKVKVYPGNLVCVEALWGADTSGWFLVLSAVLESSQEYETMDITVISEGGDIRRFNALAPPWPEAVLAQEIGGNLAREYGAEFFFPAPVEPDDDCPGWLERDQAIQCIACQKLILPSISESRRKDMCYPCERKLKEDD